MAGCSSSTVKEDIHSPQTPLIWPSPPEPARISYYKSIETPADIGAKVKGGKRLEIVPWMR